jgi:hypothetical protein
VASLAIFGAVVSFLFSIYVIIKDEENRVIGSALFFGLTAVGLIYYFLVVRRRGISART